MSAGKTTGAAMTRQHFQLIADVLATSYGRQAGNTGKLADAHREEVRDIAYRFASALRSTNERFDVDRFITACKVDR